MGRLDNQTQGPIGLSVGVYVGKEDARNKLADMLPLSSPRETFRLSRVSLTISFLRR